MIRGVFFDANGVLYDRNESTVQSVRHMLASLGYATSQTEEVQRHLKHLSGEATCGRISHEEYWSTYLAFHGVKDDSLVKDLLKQISENTDSIVPVPGSREVLETLRKRNKKIGVITDTMVPLEVKLMWLDAAGLPEHIFDAFVCSTVIGARKPDAAMYEDAAAQAGITCGEALFVGHAADELEGAKEAGMVTAAVNADPGAIGDYNLAALQDLLELPLLRE